MATQSRIRIRRNPYHGYEVWLWANGELTRRSFDNGIDLAFKLAADCISDRDIEAACDLLDSLEWEEPEYPLGVSYRPVAEAVCDCGDSAPACTVTFYTPDEPSRLWEWLAATLKVGAVFGPWALLMIFCRIAWGWAEGWW